MADDMPQPHCWVSISVEGDQHFVHVREGAARSMLGPLPSHREAAMLAKQEAARLRLIGNML